ncbi:sigma-54 specific transcriptional regulator [Onishia taeanensis]|uniref:Sigma-54 specific transcriptional regulator n=1 Tax=Onishia taeanensis TaxID=284577 RepID=A0A1G7N9F0_9GAMM|nr:sigma 54-interacting transcriptional regulator [Halomonas taeanensis]SDF70576.1 sigma-54 specific transcriptional regulator [Halomonas taeanensis]
MRDDGVLDMGRAAAPVSGPASAQSPDSISDPGTALAGMAEAMRLVEGHSPSELRCRGLALLRERLALPWARCLALDLSGRWLSDDEAEDRAEGHDDSSVQALRLACDDFRHPYAHAIRRGESLSMGLGEARSRLDHPVFQASIAGLPAAWRLAVRPLRARDGRCEWLGVLAFAGPAERLDSLSACDDFMAFEALLCRLWAWLARQHDERRDQARLRDSLAKLNDGARRRTLSERLGQRILGDSPAIRSLRSQMVRAAETNLAVLLQGETGTGKELVARGIHEVSARHEGPFLAINCAAIPETLLEAELFGHVRGAFSGAERAREGLFGEANGGTLFLDEVGDMPLALQAKLLRVLESGRYRPLGGDQERQVDLRLVAATHQPLHRRIREGAFRADLYYRLGQFPITLPALGERREDIPLLSQAFIDDFCRREGREDIGLGRATLRALAERDFPGNVRELKNLIDYACAMTRDGEDIVPDVLPTASVEEQVEEQVDEKGEEGDPEAASQAGAENGAGKAQGTQVDDVVDLRRALRDYEATLIRQRLVRYDGNRTLAAESLGLPKRTLAHKCRQLELDTP